MNGFEIDDIVKAPAGTEGLRAHGLDEPREPGARPASHLTIRGWAVGASAAVTGVEIVDCGVVVARCPVDIARPDIARLHAGAPGVERAGFRVLVGGARLSRTFTLLVRVVLEDGRRATVATIEGRRPELKSDYEPRLQPLMLTTLGRSGSTWMMRLLEASPAIVVHDRFPYEARVTMYWFELFRTLVDPDSYLRQLTIPTDLGDNWWAGGPGFRPPPMDPALDALSGGRRVRDLASFCQRQIDALYGEIAELSGLEAPAYFAEKLMMRGLIPDLVWELYRAPKEIVLVRDFRDVVCSILAFIEKRGHSGWGRDRAKSDEDWIRQFASQAEAIRGQWEARADRAWLARYEDLILRPVETVTVLLEYLELPSEESAARALLDLAAREMPGADQHRTAADAASSVGRWRRDLSAELLAVCDESLGPALEAFGYEPTWSAEPSVAGAGG